MLDYTDLFTCEKRSNASYFYCLKNPQDEGIGQLIQQIHEDEFEGCMPNDWIYAETYYAFERLAICDNENDFHAAMDEIEGDPYTSELLDWAQHGFAQSYIQRVLDEERPSSLDGLLRQAQVWAKERIYLHVWEFLLAKMNELKNYDSELKKKASSTIIYHNIVE